MENPVPLGRFKAVRSRDLLADALREQILTGLRPNGSVLPAERDLVAETGLSRTAVRDALRVLEGEGLIETRPGRYGGSVVRRSAVDALTKPVALFARACQVSLRELIEARVAIEPMIAELAARRRTPEQLRTLSEVTAALEDAVDDVARFAELNVQWHLTLAQAGHNTMLQAFISSVASLIVEVTSRQGTAPEPTRQLILRSHQRVLEAIRDGDAAAARRRTERHVAGYLQHYGRAGEGEKDTAAGSAGRS